MVQRAEALCNDKFIGIEYIYTIKDGKQINEPEKLSEIRSKSRNNELFCTCGCGANLILVAGDKNLRQQHFRIKKGTDTGKCTFISEGQKSIDSKIVLKCWLIDNLNINDLEERVPIFSVDKSDRKYEFTFVSNKRKIALDYNYNRVNLSDEKMNVLKDNSSGIKLIHIVDSMNEGTDGQYPENMMKVQEKQGYCLFLAVEDRIYDESKMKAVLYEKNIDGLWSELIIAEGFLKEFKIDDNGSLSFGNQSLMCLLENEKQKFIEKNEEEKKKREYEQKQEKVWKAERRKQILELQKRQKEYEEKINVQATIKEKEFVRNDEPEKYENIVKDPCNDTYIRCEKCGKLDRKYLFIQYGGVKWNYRNVGICRDCYCSPQ